MKKIKVLCYGDSNTYGYDPRTFGRYEKDIRWVSVLEEYGYETVNEGLNGREIPSNQAEIDNFENILTKNKDVDIIILALGINDAHNPPYDRDKFSIRWENIFKNVNILKQLIKSGKRVFLIAPPSDKVSKYFTENIDSAKMMVKTIYEQYRNIAEKYGVTALDAGEWDIEMSFDCIHFSEEGHKSFAKRIDNAIKSNYLFNNNDYH